MLPLLWYRPSDQVADVKQYFGKENIVHNEYKENLDRYRSEYKGYMIFKCKL